MSHPVESPAQAGEVLHAAAQELHKAADELSTWRRGIREAGSEDFSQLQSLLRRIDALDGRTAGARRALGRSSSPGGGDRSALATYEAALQRTLHEFQELEGVLQDQRQRLSPRIDSGARGSVARSAYARALSQS